MRRPVHQFALLFRGPLAISAADGEVERASSQQAKFSAVSLLLPLSLAVRRFMSKLLANTAELAAPPAVLADLPKRSSSPSSSSVTLEPPADELEQGHTSDIEKTPTRYSRGLPGKEEHEETRVEVGGVAMKPSPPFFPDGGVRAYLAALGGKSTPPLNALQPPSSRGPLDLGRNRRSRSTRAHACSIVQARSSSCPPLAFPTPGAQYRLSELSERPSAGGFGDGTLTHSTVRLQRNQLRDHPSALVSLIGSLHLGILFACGLGAGRIFDLG